MILEELKEFTQSFLSIKIIFFEKYYFSLEKHCVLGIIFNMSKNIQDQLREAIRKSEQSCYRISKLAGVTESQLSLFLNHQRSLTLDSAAKIADVLGLELTPKKSRKRG